MCVLEQTWKYQLEEEEKGGFAALLVSVCGQAAGKQPDAVFSESSCGSLHPDGAHRISGTVPDLAQLSVTQGLMTRPSQGRAGTGRRVQAAHDQ